MRRIGLVAWLISITASATAHAQVVRGTVTERVSGQRLSGVVVSVASATDSSGPGGIRHALTSVTGEFAITIPGAGSYVLSAKRIGVARFSTPVFEMRSGESRRFEVVLERFEQRLPNVAVSATNLCLPRRDQLKTFVALWDEARTALIASELSVEDMRITGWLSQYQRSLDPA